MITIYFKTTPIIIKFLEQCILPRIMPVAKSLFVVNINFLRHHTISPGSPSHAVKGVASNAIDFDRSLLFLRRVVLFRWWFSYDSNYLSFTSNLQGGNTFLLWCLPVSISRLCGSFFTQFIFVYINFKKIYKIIFIRQ